MTPEQCLAPAEGDSTEQLLTVCADGLKKTGPTRFELLRQDFSPEQDIRMMMLQRF